MRKLRFHFWRWTGDRVGQLADLVERGEDPGIEVGWLRRLEIWMFHREMAAVSE